MPKFKVNDPVKVDGKPGVVTEVAVHDSHWFKDGQEQLYSVRLDEKIPHMVTHETADRGCAVPLAPHLHRQAKDENGNALTHQHTLGAVKESRIAKG